MVIAQTNTYDMMLQLCDLCIGEKSLEGKLQNCQKYLNAY